MNIKMKYKCRNCGEYVEEVIHAKKDIDLEKRDAVRIRPNYNRVTIASINDPYYCEYAKLISSHMCKNNMRGVTDLISINTCDDDLEDLQK